MARKRLRGAHTLEFARLEHAQQGGLELQRDVGDFIEEERPAVGQFKAAHAIGLGVGEGAFDVAEQLALEHAFGESAHVDW